MRRHLSFVLSAVLAAALPLWPGAALAASGNTLIEWSASAGVPPATNFATFDTRNDHAVLDFDTTTSECAYFVGVMPRNYAGGGITVYIHAALTSATSGTLGWLIAFERVSDSQVDIDSTSFSSDTTVTATTVPGTSGHVSILSANIANGSAMDSVAVGEGFRLRVCRDVSNDTAAGDAELWAVEIKEQ